MKEFYYVVYASQDGEDYEVITELTSDKVSFRDQFTNEQLLTTHSYYVEAVFPAYKLSSNVVKADLDLDTDDDGLMNYQEEIMGSDPSLVDSDGDGLNDYYEVKETNTSPILFDTDENGITDDQEDIDQDGLSNIDEQGLQTNPKNIDTDHDGLKDGDETVVGTDPLKWDTDNDNLLDGEEDPLGFDPTKQDTDGDETIDGDEIVVYTTTPTKANQSDRVLPAVTINTKASEGEATTITSLEGNPLLNEDIPGFIGPAFDFNTTVDFDEAELTFQYDESVVTNEFRPEIFYYNEEAQRLERLENQTHDPKTRAVTATVTHFSSYILLNGEKWDKVWEQEIRPPSIDEDGNIRNLDVAFSIDSSGSMTSNDESGIRKEAAKNFVGKLRDTDRAAVVDFDSSARTLISLTSNKDKVKDKIDDINSSGGTDLYIGVIEAINELKGNSTEENDKIIIFLTDGNGSWDDRAIQEADDNGIMIYTIGLGHGVDDELLTRIAEETGGKYYFAENSDQLEEIFDETAGDTIDYTLDEDEDGIPDYLEESGIRTGLGTKFINSNQDYDGDSKMNGYEDADSDGDGLLDGNEIEISHDTYNNKVYFKIHSNPLKKDSDSDGIDDGDEPIESRLTYNFSLKHGAMFSHLAYVNMESYEDDNYTIKQIAENGLEKEILDVYHEHLSDSVTLDNVGISPIDDLADWKLVAAEDSHMAPFSGFGAFAVKNGKKIIISYRGTDGSPKCGPLTFLGPGFCPFGSNFNDWKNNAGIFFVNDNSHAEDAKEFAADIVMDYPDAEVYVTGHSLGGWLAQVISYELEENQLDDTYWFWSWKAKNKMKNILSNNDYYRETLTFNPAPFFEPIGFNGSYYKDIASNKYDDIVTNYYIKGDPLYNARNFIDVATMGKEVLFEFPSFGKKEHDLANFYYYAK